VTANTLELLAEWAPALRFDVIPSEALRTARRAVLDTLAVTLFGSRSQAARIAAQTAMPSPAPPFMASGIRQAFTMTMALHVGLTARDGIHAALLAAAGSGETAPPDGRFGFIRLFGGTETCPTSRWSSRSS
jgi:2-methylcitrate dehydratase PrpD